MLPPEADNLRTSQTRFYCTFGKKGRLIVPAVAGRDYYLLIVPLLVCIHACVHVRVCMCVCACACVHVRVHVCMWTCA